ncbi:phosphoglycerate dehydrogenase [Scatolibacter rhodanostii]|uniref:phosphoglycerate dehydrogenase n=1 Tax=Scatolibacter rhodanostii TaxID=2014781 RepID=UPI000C07CDC3|nr:phosphoglycerate dehydrogenase [Scatolibacter rhodanostii]
MYKILCLNQISKTGTDRFGNAYEYSTEMKNADGILVRSASMHDMAFNSELKAIARAGAGVNNIPIDKCTEQGIVVFNTPGANANAVKELVIASLFLTSRRVAAAMDWVKTLKGQGAEVGKLVEKGKGNFGGPEIKGKTLGVIGLGAIGILVANAARNLGMTVYGFDPYLSVDAAWSLSHGVLKADSMDDIFAKSDYITLHVPLTDDTKGLVGDENFAKMKDGVRILNFARGELVDSSDMIKALATGKVSAYATDFPTDDLIGVENVIAIPHLGASTPESEDNCAEMAVDEIKDYLENGNITHSVNLPALSMPRIEGTRISIIHKNIPSTIANLTTICGKANINIEHMLSKSKKSYAYTILDVSGEVSDSAIETISALDEVIRIRVL